MKNEISLAQGSEQVQKFAKIVADAYANQYHGDRKVMNNPVVIFNRSTEKFSCQSSLTPLMDDEVEVETLEEGIYGDFSDCTPEETRDFIEEYICREVTYADLLDKIEPEGELPF